MIHIILAAVLGLGLGMIVGFITGTLECDKARVLAAKARDEALVLRNRLQEAEGRVHALKQEIAKKL